MKIQGDRMYFPDASYHQNQTQRGKTITTQGVLPFQYEQEKNDKGMTPLAGLPAYLDLSHAIGFWKLIKKHIQGRKESQGWTDTQVVMSFILLNLAGGDCVDDLEVINNDEGFCRLLQRIWTGLNPRHKVESGAI